MCGVQSLGTRRVDFASIKEKLDVVATTSSSSAKLPKLLPATHPIIFSKKRSPSKLSHQLIINSCLDCCYYFVDDRLSSASTIFLCLQQNTTALSLEIKHHTVVLLFIRELVQEESYLQSMECLWNGLLDAAISKLGQVPKTSGSDRSLHLQQKTANNGGLITTLFL
ncbi:MAG: hypothetical protein PUP93_29010 [Rhizonema sp. NSF051]|nr:hypothetical protein [Rhizonema sp. NSF051]